MKLSFFILLLIFSFSIEQILFPIGQGILRYNFCRDPDRFDLNMIHSQLEAQMLLNGKESFVHDIYDLDYTDGVLIEKVSNLSGYCSITETLYENRKWRYPFERNITKCSANQLNNGNENSKNGKKTDIKCSEIIEIVPALLKTGKCLYGVFEWVSIFERVPIDCN